MLGLVIALGGIVGGLILEGGNIKEIIAPTAAMIVLGGTFGAVLVTTPMSVVLHSMKAMKDVFLEQSETPGVMIEQIVEYATKARKNGIVALEEDAARAPDPFLKKALNLAVDGTDLQ
ncbi:MAG: motility protein A, partial [Bryobacteraceae bacterium]